jgi:hypothetical protein
MACINFLHADVSLMSCTAAASSKKRGAVRRRMGRADIEREYQQVTSHRRHCHAEPCTVGAASIHVRTQLSVCCLQGLLTSLDFEDPQDAEHAGKAALRWALRSWLQHCPLVQVGPVRLDLHAGACDLGLPDSEICSGLTTPPVVMSSLQEAWSRGCGSRRASC